MALDLSTIKNTANAVAETEDHTKVTAGFVREPAPEGKTVARLVGYVDLGKQAQRPYKGQPKPPAEEVRLTFELLSPKHIKEIEVEGGEKKKIANRVTFTIAKKFSDKAKFKKLFSKMDYGRGIKHMSQMIGDPFIVTVVHKKVEKEGQEPRIYENLYDDSGAWLIEAPVITDPLSGDSTAVPVPEAIGPYQAFFWNNPTQEMWDSLFIDGTRTVKRDGKEVEVSRNFVQETILKATNIEGSPLAEMLGGLDNLSIDPTAPSAEDEDAGLVDDDGSDEDEAPKETKAAKGKAPAAPKAEKPAADKKGDQDALAALGLA